MLSSRLVSDQRQRCPSGLPPDLWAGIMHPEHGLLQVYPGLNPDVELGEVVTGTSAGRESPEQTIFSFNYGLAIFDILVANRILHAI